MADILLFFVMVFSRGEAGELRAEAAIKARDKKHAASLASHYVGDRQGAIAMSHKGNFATAAEGAEIFARFGDVPDDSALHFLFG
jgi:hypothetical protein